MIAFKFSITMSNLDEPVAGLSKKFSSLNERAKKATFQALARLGTRIHRDAVFSILHEAKSGIVYKTKKREHQASAPGEAPASDTGFLASHISLMFDANKPEVMVRSRAPYSKWLEFGTLRIAPRPFMSPAFLRNKDSAVRELKIAWSTP